MSKKRPRVSLRSALRQTGSTALYPAAGHGTGPALAYVGLGLTGEAGEVANQLKKVMRDDGGVPSVERSAKLFDELGDVLWYWLRCCAELGFDPYDVIHHNLTKLARRKETGTLQGDTAADGTRGGVDWSEDPEPEELPTVPTADLLPLMAPSGYEVYVVDEETVYEFRGEGRWVAARIVDQEVPDDVGPIWTCATAEALGRLIKVPGQTAYVVDEQQVYVCAEGGEWIKTEHLANTLRFGQDQKPAENKSPHHALTVRIKHGITYPPFPSDGAELDVAGFLYRYHDGEGWVTEWERNPNELGPWSQRDGCVVGRDVVNGRAWDTALYDDPQVAYNTLVTHERKPVTLEQDSRGMRVSHVLRCACVCADGGPWVVSGFRELGVQQDMYRHLREVHTNPGAAVEVRG